MNQTEEWRPVVGYEGLYEVSDLGRVKSVGRITNGKNNTIRKLNGRIMKGAIKPAGYPCVTLTLNKAVSTHYVHRMVASAFIKNQENKRTVNHKNGIKTDNRVKNLEWATYSENGLHSFLELGRKPSCLGVSGKDHHSSKGIVKVSLNGEIVKEYDCINDVERLEGIPAKQISQTLTGRQQTCYGFKWKYKKDMK